MLGCWTVEESVTKVRWICDTVVLRHIVIYETITCRLSPRNLFFFPNVTQNSGWMSMLSNLWLLHLFSDGNRWFFTPCIFPDKLTRCSDLLLWSCDQLILQSPAGAQSDAIWRFICSHHWVMVSTPINRYVSNPTPLIFGIWVQFLFWPKWRRCPVHTGVSVSSYIKCYCSSITALFELFSFSFCQNDHLTQISQLETVL